MTIPGFTAEASLYQAPCHYVEAPNHSSSGLVPQLPVGNGMLEICREYCECCRYYSGCCFACWFCEIIIFWPYPARGSTAA
jgi:hypothetical protein